MTFLLDAGQQRSPPTLAIAVHDWNFRLRAFHCQLCCTTDRVATRLHSRALTRFHALRGKAVSSRSAAILSLSLTAARQIMYICIYCRTTTYDPISPVAENSC